MMKKCILNVTCLILLLLVVTVSENVAFVDAEGQENQDTPTFKVNFFDMHIPVWTNMFESWNKFQQNVPNLNFLEVGSLEGRSTIWLLNNILTHETSRITCVDTFEGNDGSKLQTTEVLDGLFERFKNNTSRFASKVTISRGLSSVQLKKASLQMNQRFDFIYIDADHTSKGVLEDAILSFPLLAVMGVMVFDDYLVISSLNRGT